MSNSTAVPVSPQPGGDLDHLLRQWKQQTVLTAEEANEIRSLILRGEDALPAEWWLQFSHALSRVLDNANRLQQQVTTAYVPGMRDLQPWWQSVPHEERYFLPVRVG